MNQPEWCVLGLLIGEGGRGGWVDGKMEDLEDGWMDEIGVDGWRNRACGDAWVKDLEGEGIDGWGLCRWMDGRFGGWMDKWMDGIGVS